jgi:hypothetical protein
MEATARTLSRLLYPSVNVASRVDSIAPYGAFESKRLTALSEAYGAAWPRAARRFGVTHVVFPSTDDRALRQAVEGLLEGALRVQASAVDYEAWVTPHRPWAFFASGTVPVGFGSGEMELPADALGILSHLMARGDEGTVVLELAYAVPTSPGQVLGFDRSAERIEVEAESQGPALLVIQDAWWPGWRASIDGRPTEIFAADALVRAVRWPPGRHLLEMSYEPPEIGVGLALSSVGAVLLLLLAALALRRSHAAQAAATASPSAESMTPERTSGGR